MQNYILLALCLLTLLSTPKSIALRCRSAAVGLASPAFRYARDGKGWFLKITTVWPSGGYNTPPQVVKELEMLRLENHQLKSQVRWLKEELKLESLMRKEEIVRQLELYAHAITARVIFRESAAWKSSVWVNVGEATNRRLNVRLIEKNSPVVLGTAVLGIVDYVGEERSVVRLVTDRAVCLSARLIRSGAYLAKGHVQGARAPLWRTLQTTLAGVGFNYDFEDEKGGPHPLTRAIVQEGDHVVTTGMDGLFPAGLQIGKVAKVHPLKEGASSCELDIFSCIESFEELEFVTILPPLSIQNQFSLGEKGALR